MDVSAYLRRIGYDGPLVPTGELLRQLHRAHMLSVPFENLDIGLNRPIILDESRFFAKIVEHDRGGFCYELNGLFAGLLRALGYTVEYLSARVTNAQGGRTREFDHMTLQVKTPVEGGCWIADVGFGDSALEPLRLDADVEQPQEGAVYRLTEQGERWRMERSDGSGAWNVLYDFALTPFQLADFSEMCDFHQSSPESWFTTRRICSRATSSGRVTLSNMDLIVTDVGGRHQRKLQSEEEVRAVLWEHFGIVL